MTQVEEGERTFSLTMGGRNIPKLKLYSCRSSTKARRAEFGFRGVEIRVFTSKGEIQCFVETLFQFLAHNHNFEIFDGCLSQR